MRNDDFFSSEFAETIFNSKYAKTKKNGKKENISDAATRIAINENKYDTELKKEMVEKTRYFILEKYFSPGGGQWRAAGTNTNKISNVNCTTLAPPKDNLESIFESLYWWGKFAAYGQGNGVDLSGLRPKGMPLHNTAKTATGAVSFMPYFDTVLATIAQQGRRGASLISIQDTYPDFESFCKIKGGKNNLSTANISIQITDDFMKAAIDDKEWILRWQSLEYEDDKVIVKKSAKELFDLLVSQAWLTGDPGIQFIDRMRDYSNSDIYGKKYKVTSSNACSEQVLDPFNTCVLASISLVYAPLEIDEFLKWLKELSFFGIRYLDNVVLNELNEKRSPSKIQLEKMRSMTRVGLGITGWADWLIRKKVKYDGPAALELANTVFSNFRKYTIQASNELGAERGTFGKFDFKKARRAKHYRELIEENLISEDDIKHLRHVASTTYAPTGTISIILGAGGTGIEPIFSKYYVRRERSSNDGRWNEWFVFNEAVSRYLKENHRAVTRENVKKFCNEDFWSTAYNVDNVKKIDFLKIVQHYCDSSISTTFNLPINATKDNVRDIYLSAWKAGLKGATVYREGSKTGVLITENNYNNIVDEGREPYKIKRHYAPPRPKELPCDVYHITSEKKNWLVLIGKMGDEPYEIFAGLEDKINIPKKYKEGKIVKEGKKRYSLRIPVEEDDNLSFNDILALFENTEYNVLTRMISMSLRHGTPIHFISDQLSKEKQDFSAFNKAIARVLKKYIKDGEKVMTGVVCPSCGSKDMVYQSGCAVCLKCGYSKCS